MRKVFVLGLVLILVLVTGCNGIGNFGFGRNSADDVEVYQGKPDKKKNKNKNTEKAEELKEDFDVSGQFEEESDKPYGEEVYAEDTNPYSNQNAEAVNAFKEFVNGPYMEFYYSSDLVIPKEDYGSVKACLIELGSNHVPVLFIMYDNAAHYQGYVHALQYVDGSVVDVISCDDFENVYADSGVVIGTHMGGSYGETDRYYFALNDNDVLTYYAWSSIMEDDYYAKEYEEMNGFSFNDTYWFSAELLNGTEDREATQDDFYDWFNYITANEYNIIPIAWKPLSDLF